MAIEAADITLSRNDLADVVTAIDLARATMRSIKQNLFWAFAYNVIGIPIAAGALYPTFGIRLNPMLGQRGDEPQQRQRCVKQPQAQELSQERTYLRGKQPHPLGKGKSDGAYHIYRTED